MKYLDFKSKKMKKGVARETLFAEFVRSLCVPKKLDVLQSDFFKLPKEEQDTAKASNGAYILGDSKDGCRSIASIISRSAITWDNDHPTTSFFDSLHDSTVLDGFHWFAHTTCKSTPNSPRYRIIFELSRDVTPEEYNAVSRLLAQNIGVINELDPCSHSAARLMFYPVVCADGAYDTKEEGNTPIDVDAFLSDYKDWQDPSTLPISGDEKVRINTERKTRSDPRNYKGIRGAFNRTISDIGTAIDTFLVPDVYVEGSTEGRYSYALADSTNGLVIYDRQLAYDNHASSPAHGKVCDSFDIVCFHLFGNPNEKPAYDKMCEWALQQEGVKEELTREREESFTEAFEADEGWEEYLERDTHGKLISNTKNAVLILSKDPTLDCFAQDDFARAVVFRTSPPWGEKGRYWRDQDDVQLACYIDRKYGAISRKTIIEGFVKVSEDRRFHPVREYLDTLPEWDGKERVDTLLIDYLLADDNEYVRAVTRKTLCAAVARIYEPGIKFDTMLVLDGEQGSGKSTFIRLLGGDWYTDNLCLSDMHDKSGAEKLQQRWIVEIGELAGVKKVEMDAVKAFVSRQVDEYRAAYGRVKTIQPRECVIFGTVNGQSGFLRDETGNRRFWIVPCKGTKETRSKRFIKFERDQIWAEAKWKYEIGGEPLFLPPELEIYAEEHQTEALEQDDREGIVIEYLEKLLPANWKKMEINTRRSWLNGTDLTAGQGQFKRVKVCRMEIWCECFGKQREAITRRDSREITKILQRLGWVQGSTKARCANYGVQFMWQKK